jgi:hypothetical protein
MVGRELDVVTVVTNLDDARFDTNECVLAFAADAHLCIRGANDRVAGEHRERCADRDDERAVLEQRRRLAALLIEDDGAVRA